MIGIEFENPNQVDRLADFAIQKIQSASDKILYVARALNRITTILQ